MTRRDFPQFPGSASSAPPPRGALAIVMAGSRAVKGHLAELDPIGGTLTLDSPKGGHLVTLRLEAIRCVTPVRS